MPTSTDVFLFCHFCLINLSSFACWLCYFFSISSFLNLSVKRKNNITQGVDKLRFSSERYCIFALYIDSIFELYFLCRSAFQGTVPENLYAISPPSSATIEKFGNPDIINQQRSVINVLSESNSNSDQFEAAADEIAQLISQHTGNVGVNEEGAAFVKFQSTRSHR